MVLDNGRARRIEWGKDWRDGSADKCLAELPRYRMEFRLEIKKGFPPQAMLPQKLRRALDTSFDVPPLRYVELSWNWDLKEAAIMGAIQQTYFVPTAKIDENALGYLTPPGRLTAREIKEQKVAPPYLKQIESGVYQPYNNVILYDELKKIIQDKPASSHRND